MLAGVENQPSGRDGREARVYSPGPFLQPKDTTTHSQREASEAEVGREGAGLLQAIVPLQPQLQSRWALALQPTLLRLVDPSPAWDTGAAVSGTVEFRGRPRPSLTCPVSQTGTRKHPLSSGHTEAQWLTVLWQ